MLRADVRKLVSESRAVDAFRGQRAPAGADGGAITPSNFAEAFGAGPRHSLSLSDLPHSLFLRVTTLSPTFLQRCLHDMQACVQACVPACARTICRRVCRRVCVCVCGVFM